MIPLPAAAGAAAMMCGPLNIAGWACCALNATSAVCCSLASCFGCKYTSKLAKSLYIIVFFCSAVLGIFLRYWGKEMMASWVTNVSNVCSQDQCWGMQGAYRVSLAVATWFAIMAVLTFMCPVTHLAGWLVKLLLYIFILGLTLLVPPQSMIDYASAARGFSVIFLLAQVLIILDFAYNAHEYLVRKMEEKNREFERQGWEPGVCSNGYGVIYIIVSAVLQLAGIIGLALLFKFFGGCPLNNFFTAETMIIGTVTTILCMMGLVGRGLLPPSIVFAYNVALCYQAITNNPDVVCNAIARTESQDTASIIAGLAVSSFSVTWMAYSSAGSMRHAVSYGPAADDVVSGTIVNPVPASGVAPAVTDWGTSGKPKTPPVGAAASYQRAAGAEGDAEEEEEGRARGTASSASAVAEAASASSDDAIDPNAWIFHCIMCLGGMYLAMLVTNWGNPGDANSPSVNPELSAASMWARIGSQWAIHALFTWTLIAPACCPNRDFSR